MGQISKLFGKLKQKPEGGSKGSTGAGIGAGAGTVTVTGSSQATTSTTMASSEQTPAADSAKLNIPSVTSQSPSASPLPVQPAARPISSDTAPSSTDITTLPKFNYSLTSSVSLSSNSSASVNLTYSPLAKPTEIRLLSIRAGASQLDICCDLINADLANLTYRYEALSYVWGDSLKPCKIYVGPSRQVLRVTMSAHTALLRLRHADKPRLVWVDAICIDQTNIPERNSQVAMMARIYKTASRVVANLGKATHEVETGIKYLQEIARRNPATDVMSPHQEGRPLRVNDPNCPVWYSGKKSTEADRKFWMGPVNKHVPAVWVDENTPTSLTPRFPTKQELSSLLRLFEYPWFTRAWVVQEMYHAVDVTVLCEPYSFEWVSFEWFIEKWNQGRDRMGVYALPYVLNVRNPVRSTKRLWSLLNGSFRSCASTDARDKVYAVMSMAADPQPHILYVDYAATVAMVFSRVATVLFYQVGLNLLSAIRGPSTVAGTPTWVPDWTMSSEADKIYNKMDKDIMRPFHPAGGPPDWTVAELTSAPRGSANWPSGHSGLVLKVRGVRVGRIRWIGEPWDPKDGDWRVVVRRWKHVAQGLNIRQYPSARPINLLLSKADPLSSRVSQQEHASKAQYPTQANGGYKVTDMDMFDSLLAAGLYKDVENPQKLRKETEENDGVPQMWQCKFDHDTLFHFDWPRGGENKFFKDVNLTRERVPSGSEIFYRAVIADGAHTLGADWQFGAYHIFGERLYTSSSGSGQGPPPAAKDETQRQEQLRLYEEAARNAMAGRRFFVTDEGYVGLAPKEAAVNDVVVVFLGDMNSSVLKWRANPSSFDFVGQCYVFGASFGEAVKHIHVSRLLAKVPRAPLEDFLLW